MGIRNERGGYVPQEPTPDEIREACREIREGWSEAERAKRWSYPAENWTPPVVSAKELFGEVDLGE